MKVLVLTGPESSGKSWLAEHIQATFCGLLVGEYVRHFIEREQRDTCYADISAIAQGLTFYQQCEHWLRLHQQPLQCIQGDWAQRREQTLKTVAHWLNSMQQHTGPGQ